MTSDAKIGLLLGLVFIFIIAFIINGLPNFNRESNSSELTTTMVSQQNNTPGIGTKERKVRRELISRKKPALEVQSSAQGNQNIRFSTPLPKSGAVAKDTGKVKSIAPGQPLTPAEKKKIRPVKTSRPSRPKFYTVCDGDNLGAIAKKFYGPEQGNKNVNINRIFKANRRILRSPDEIYVGWKLIIPPLSALASKSSKASSVVSSGILKKVKSIGKKLPSADRPKTGKSRLYVVKEGDSLWRIAAKQLGSGSRYTEIIELNAVILNDEDNIAVGMRLKIPAR